MASASTMSAEGEGAGIRFWKSGVLELRLTKSAVSLAKFLAYVGVKVLLLFLRCASVSHSARGAVDPEAADLRARGSGPRRSKSTPHSHVNGKINPSETHARCERPTTQGGARGGSSSWA